jgi:hypothetical protein
MTRKHLVPHRFYNLKNQSFPETTISLANGQKTREIGPDARHSQNLICAAYSMYSSGSNFGCNDADGPISRVFWIFRLCLFYLQRFFRRHGQSIRFMTEPFLIKLLEFASFFQLGNSCIDFFL